MARRPARGPPRPRGRARPGARTAQAGPPGPGPSRSPPPTRGHARGCPQRAGGRARGPPSPARRPPPSPWPRACGSSRSRPACAARARGTRRARPAPSPGDRARAPACARPRAPLPPPRRQPPRAGARARRLPPARSPRPDHATARGRPPPLGWAASLLAALTLDDLGVHDLAVVCAGAVRGSAVGALRSLGLLLGSRGVHLLGDLVERLLQRLRLGLQLGHVVGLERVADVLDRRLDLLLRGVVHRVAELVQLALGLVRGVVGCVPGLDYLALAPVLVV